MLACRRSAAVPRLLAAAAVAVVLAAAVPVEAAGVKRVHVVRARPIAGPVQESMSLGEGETQTVVVRDVAAWRTVWVEAGRQAEDAPSVDFSQRMVVGVGAVFVDGCHGPRIHHATLRSDGATVRWRRGWRRVLDVPFCTGAVVRAWDWAVVPRTDGTVVFREREHVPIRR